MLAALLPNIQIDKLSDYKLSILELLQKAEKNVVYFRIRCFVIRKH